MKKKRKKASAHKIRMFLAFIVFGGITAILSYNLLENIFAIRKMTIEKKELTVKIDELVNEKKILETDIKKLEDPDYIAKYVREKYFYSKDGELILRIEK